MRFCGLRQVQKGLIALVATLHGASAAGVHDLTVGQVIGEKFDPIYRRETKFRIRENTRQLRNRNPRD